MCAEAYLALAIGGVAWVRSVRRGISGSSYRWCSMGEKYAQRHIWL